MNHINFYYLLIMLNIMLGTDGNYAKMVRSINRFIEKAQSKAMRMKCSAYGLWHAYGWHSTNGATGIHISVEQNENERQLVNSWMNTQLFTQNVK